MYLIEKTFIMKFIACLKKMGVTEIPYDNTEFYSGAESMREYFQLNRDAFGRYSNELAMLFLKNPKGGAFTEFKEGIARQNGGLMSFDNPHYVCAKIKLDEQGAAYILNQSSPDIPNDQIYKFTRVFCTGAGVICE